MAIVPLFDATKWIAGNLHGGTRIRPDAMGAFVSFASMWNLFEGVWCRNSAGPQEFARIAGEIAGRPVDPQTRAAVSDYAAYWRERLSLVLPIGLQECAKSVSGGQHNAISDEALTLMTSANHIKRSLFQELKSVRAINGQIENLDVASQSLGAVMVMSGSKLILRRPRR